MLDLASVASGPELAIAIGTHFLHVLDRGLQEVTGVKFLGVAGQGFAHRSGDRQAVVGVDVHLAHTALDTLLDFFHGHAVGFGDRAAVLVDQRQQIFGNRRRTMHHQVGVGETVVDFFNAADGQDFAGRLAGELVSTVAGADRHCQSIHLGLFHEVGCFIGVGQQLGVIQLAFKAVTIFCFAHAGFQRTQATQFAFHAHTQRVGNFHHFAGHVHVVLVARGGLRISFQRAIHHHAGEAVFDGRVAGGRLVTVVLVHADGDVGIGFHSCQDQVTQEVFASVVTSTTRRLQDHGAIGFIGCPHDRLDLLHVVDVEGRNAVAIFCRVVEQKPHGYERHRNPPKIDLYRCLDNSRPVECLALILKQLLPAPLFFWKQELKFRRFGGFGDLELTKRPIDQA